MMDTYSELAAACGQQATCDADQRPVRASSMIQYMFRCRITKLEINILFAVCQVLS